VLAESIRAQLQRLNSEFAHYVPAGYQLPTVTLRPAGDPEYFPGRRQAPLHAGNERPVMSQEGPDHQAGSYQILERIC